MSKFLDDFFTAILKSVPSDARKHADCEEISEDMAARYDRWLLENILADDMQPDEVADVRDILVNMLQGYTGWLKNRGHIDPERRARQIMLREIIQAAQVEAGIKN
jgi:hypothetical protein